MVKRDVGGMGEDHFAGWCSEVGITANRVARDRTGWDYQIEFPLSHDAALPVPLDLQAKSIRAWIQVKASDGRDRAISVKLDNWVRMVDETIPAFFLVIEYDGLPYPQRAYLVHVWESHIRAVRRRLREASAGKRKTPLHRRTMAFSYGEEDRLATPDGAGFEAAVRRHVGTDPARYEAEKRRLNESVGYEDGAGELRAKMLLRADDPEGHLVDFALGRVDGLRLAGGEFRDTRFGIPAVAPTAVIPAGSTLRGAQYRQETELRFRTSRGTARMKASVYSPKHVAGLVRPEALRARIVNPFLEMVAGLTEEARFDLNFGVPSLDTALALSEWNGFAEFVLLNDAGAREGAVVDLRFVLRGKENVQRFGAVGAGKEMVAWAHVLRAAWEVADRFGLQHDLVVVHDEFRSQAEEMLAAAAALRGEPTPFALCLPADTPAPRGETRVPWVHTLRLGGQRVVLAVTYDGVLRPAGAPEPGRHCFSMDPTGVTVVGDRLLIPGETFAQEDHRRELDAIAAASERPPQAWRWWNPSSAIG